jgi:hypothetical protein
MAFLNYLAPGTYSIIDMVRYDKMSRCVAFSLRIYADASKSAEFLAHKEFMIGSGAPVQRVLGKRDIPPSIEQRNIDDMWFVGDSPEGEWLDYEDHVAKWIGTKWEFWTVACGQTFYDVSQERYVSRCAASFDYETIESWTDHWSWEQYFSTDALYADTNTNLVKQIYLYLKNTKAAFATVIDA